MLEKIRLTMEVHNQRKGFYIGVDGDEMYIDSDEHGYQTFKIPNGKSFEFRITADNQYYDVYPSCDRRPRGRK